MRSWHVLTVGAVLAVAGCAPSHAQGWRQDLPVHDAVAREQPTAVALLPTHRRWLVEIQVTMRWTHELVDTLRHWWRTPELTELAELVVDASKQVSIFAARHGAPRLIDGWSPVDDAEHPLAHRYDDMIRTGVLNRSEGLRQARHAVRHLADELMSGDLGHPDIAWLVRSIDLAAPNR